MSFYNLSKPERVKIVADIHKQIQTDLHNAKFKKTLVYFSDQDTYIRKSAYLAMGKIYQAEPHLRKKIIAALDSFVNQKDFKIRQTSINAAGEIGKTDFEIVQHFFDQGLFDIHYSVRNAVIGSIKKMGQVNPLPVLNWARKYLHHFNKEIRREICHGIELRGRTHPQDILPLLKELENDSTARVKNTLIHVIGQIAYKKDCLAVVIAHLKTWTNKKLVKEALEEIIDVHQRYKNFSYLNQKQAKSFINQHFQVNL